MVIKIDKMKRNLKNNPYVKMYLLLICVFMVCCTKDRSDAPNKGGVEVIFRPQGTAFEGDDIQIMTKATSMPAKEQNKFIFAVNVDEDYMMEGEMINISNSPGNRAQSGGDKKIAAAPVLVETGVRYMVTYFDNIGNYVGYNRYVVGNNKPYEGDVYKFNAGEKYTFIFQSNGRKDLDVRVLPSSKLDNSTITLNTSDNSGVPLDQMYKRIDATLNYGNNNIDIIFEHLFSQITVGIDTKEVGDVEKWGEWAINPLYSKVTLKESDGSTSYNEADLVSAGRIALNLEKSSTTYAKATFLIAASGQKDAEVKLSGLTIAGSTRSFSIPNVPILKGKSYALNLKIKKRNDDTPIVDGLEWAPGNLIESNGKYYFAETFELGTAFGWNSYYSGESKAYNPVGDPCSKVTGGTWRTPNHSDWQKLLRGNGRNYDLVFENGTSGRAGVRIGGSNVILPKTPDLSRRNNPNASITSMWNRTKGTISYSDYGYYWSITPGLSLEGTHGIQWGLKQGQGNAGFDNYILPQWPSYVRCVRTPK